MLVFTRRVGEKIIINDNIVITLVGIHKERDRPTKVRIGIEAPREISVHRGEVWERNQQPKGA